MIIRQPSGVCYLYVALQGLCSSDKGLEILERAVKTDGDDGFIVTFRPQQREWSCRVSCQEIAWYLQALGRATEPEDPARPWQALPLEVAYNKYLLECGEPGSAQLFDTPGGTLTVKTTAGGNTSEVLKALGCKGIFWWLPSQKPAKYSQRDWGEPPTPEEDLARLRRFLEQLRQRAATGSLVLSVGTRETIPENPQGLVSCHAYFVAKLGTDSLTLVDLRADCQREITVSLEDLAPCLQYIDGGILG